MIKVSVITSLYRCESYIKEFLDNAVNINNPEEVEILLLLNEPSREELTIIEQYVTKYSFIKLIVVPKREGLYATWNRGVKLAQGEYCTIWNVDDIRTPDSISEQAATLDTFPDAGMTYGNFTLTEKYGDKCGVLVDELDTAFYPQELLRRHLIGCFPMWRKSIHSSIGYFDEQYRLVADYEFQIRCFYNFPIVKTHSMLGYFLQGLGDEGRLSQMNELQIKERTSVEIRYGLFDNINLLYYLSALKAYNTNYITSFGEKHSIDQYIAGNKIIKNKFMYLKGLLRQPRYLARYMKCFLKKVINRHLYVFYQ